ncbi:MAG: Cobalamin-binding protein precursor [Candidatus Bathyarchaeota archaeon BA2]|nr:MAG: Cobalamin-binding protein precursor [Candidatus Bathyarchaeota archaeon BA2]
MQKDLAIRTVLVLTAILVATPLLGLVRSYTLSTLQSTEPGEITVVDWREKNVTLPGVPEKIVSLAAPCTIILYALGAGDKVVGVDKYSIDYAKEGSSTFWGAPGKFDRYVKFCDEVSNKPNLGLSWSPSIEPILGIQRDVVFMYYYPGTVGVMEKLEEMGVPVIGVSAKTSDDICRLIGLIGKVIDAEEEANALINEIKSRIDVISRNVENLTRPKVYYELTEVLRTIGNDTFSNWMIETAGGVNIFNDMIRFPKVSEEAVIERNPDVIIFGHYLPIAQKALKEGKSIADVLLEERPAWKDIKAVKDRRVHILPTYYATYDQRFVIGVELMAKWFHAEIFGIEKSVEKPIMYIQPGVSSPIAIEGIAITQVAITAAPDKCIREVMLCIRQMPPDISLTLWNVSAFEKPGFTVHIYKYLEIKLEPYIPENISEVKLSFCVENSWLMANGLSADDVALFKWNENAESWDEVATYTSYEAISPGLSMFVIAGIKPVPPLIWAQPWLWGMVVTIVIAVLALIATLRLQVLRKTKPT